MISEIIAWLWDSTLELSLLLLVIFAIQPIVKHYLNCLAAYALWLSVPLYLIVSALPITSSLTLGQTLTFYPKFEAVAPMSQSLSTWLPTVLIAIWLVPLVILSLRYSSQYARINRLGREVSLPADNDNFSFAQVRQAPIDSPAVFGVFKPTLLLPESCSYSNEQLKLILQHEHAHWKHRDGLWNIIALMIVSVFWFNPLVYLAYRQFRINQELACDLSTTQSFSPQQKARYGELLLFQSTLNSSAIVSQWFGISSTKERITMLKQHKKSPIKTAAGLVVVTALSVGSWAMASNSEPKAEAKPLTIMPPAYPRDAAQNGVEGFVRLHFDLDLNGKPQNITVAESEPEGTFDKSAIESVTQWTFVDKNKSDVYYTLQFKLGE
ncbi:M56 family metallopeptidase [Pleionea sediminis]|uniref:M56 family metallopeptidase n=1 Tax=Pleionea sediminis TaxID=2569479 RepID=UPI0011871BD9|nr:M56 family metallopeptidase [Pleionea sediminis]